MQRKKRSDNGTDISPDHIVLRQNPDDLAISTEDAFAAERNALRIKENEYERKMRFLENQNRDLLETLNNLQQYEQDEKSLQSLRSSRSRRYNIPRFHPVNGSNGSSALDGAYDNLGDPHCDYYPSTE